jgi:hypothetical protein
MTLGNVQVHGTFSKKEDFAQRLGLLHFLVADIRVFMFHCDRREPTVRGDVVAVGPKLLRKTDSSTVLCDNCLMPEDRLVKHSCTVKQSGNAST